MEILLSKLLPLFVYPLGLLCCLLIVAALLLMYTKVNIARLLVVAAVVLVFAAGNDWTAYTLMRSLENDYAPKPLPQIPTADLIVVLGGGLGLPYPPRLYPHLGGGSDRLAHALRLYRAGKAQHILLTGGNVFPQPGLKSESFYAARLLEEWGVPSGALVLETHSRNTIQNAAYTARILGERHWDSALLVTSAAHMGRAVYAFRHAGIDVIPAPTDFLAVDAKAPTILNWIPSAGALYGTTRALHEYLGRLWYRIAL